MGGGGGGKLYILNPKPQSLNLKPRGGGVGGLSSVGSAEQDR